MRYPPASEYLENHPANRSRKRSSSVSRPYTGSCPNSYWKVYGNPSAAKSPAKDP